MEIKKKRRCEDNAYNTNKTVHAIEASEEDTKTFVAEDMRRDHKNEGVSPAEHTKKVRYHYAKMCLIVW